LLTDDMKLISVDDHVFEHPRVWLDRLPSKLHDRAPQVVETEAGAEQWLHEGELVSHLEVNLGLSASAGVEWEDRSFEPMRFDQMLPGLYDPVARLKDMDEDGVWAQTCFPSFPRFAGVRFLRTKDKELARLCVRAYNDFILDEWCAAAPDRYVPLIILPLKMQGVDAFGDFAVQVRLKMMTLPSGDQVGCSGANPQEVS